MAVINPSQEELEEMLLCCRYGDLEDLIEFVNQFGDSWLESHVDENGNSALHMATANGHLDVVKYLVEHLPESRALIRPNNPPAKNTPLHWAAMNHHLEILKLLCPRLTSQEISTVNGRGWSAMSEAVEGVGFGSVAAEGTEQIPIREQCVNYLVEMMKLEAEEDEDRDESSDESPTAVVKPVEEQVKKLTLDDQPPVCLR